MDNQSFERHEAEELLEKSARVGNWAFIVLLFLVVFIGSCKVVQADQIPEDKAIRTLIGEAESEGLESMKCHASAIRNRNTLNGAFGLRAVVRINGFYYRITKRGKYKIAQKYIKQAKVAWIASKTKDFSCGANHWFSREDLRQGNVQVMIKKMELIKVISGPHFSTSFYRE